MCFDVLGESGTSNQSKDSEIYNQILRNEGLFNVVPGELEALK